MSVIKRAEWPSLRNNTGLTNFFDNTCHDSELSREVFLPAVNIKETEKTFEVELAAPGLRKNDFTVTADNGVLTISAEKKDEKEEISKRYTRKEFSCSSFSRSFTLPENVNKEEIKAKYDDGVLRLSVAKKEGTIAKQIKTIEVK